MSTNSDKRTLATDALETLGTIIDESAGRDAIHIAVEPVVAVHTLRPGDHVGRVDGGFGLCRNPVGIVDPFLKTCVTKGQRFWIFVYPRQITSLRHVWTHPEFPDAKVPEVKATTGNDPKAESIRWLEVYAASIPVRYEDLIEHAGYHIEDNSYWSQGSLFDGIYLADEFWDHYEVVTGTVVPKGKRGSFFSCSC